METIKVREMTEIVFPGPEMKSIQKPHEWPAALTLPGC